MTMRILLNELTDALLPQRCVVCERFGAALHLGCIDTLPRAEQPRCPRCWTPTRSALDTICARCEAEPPAYLGLRTPFRFEGSARRALLEAKFRGITVVLAPLAVAAAEVVPPAWGVTAVVPVPLHRARERQRGYNQAAIVAEAVAARLEVPVRPNWLRRARATAPQAGLDASRRSSNLEAAFEAAAGASGRVLLVDDVTTTGATFEAAARGLLAAGAIEVFAAAIARED